MKQKLLFKYVTQCRDQCPFWHWTTEGKWFCHAVVDGFDYKEMDTDIEGIPCWCPLEDAEG